MIKGRISISQCEAKQLNTAPCDAPQGWGDSVDRCADLFIPLLRLLFITVSFVDVGFSIMRLFKDLQEVAYPGVHPHTVVSWDLEFVGTRGSFPTLVSLLHVFTSCHHIRFSPTNHFSTPPQVPFVSSPTSPPPPCSSLRLPGLSLNIPPTPLTDFNDLSAAHFSPILLSCSCLHSPESA